MAGHPTIGSTFALARAGVIAPDREQFVFGLGIGPVPVALDWNDDELSFAWMTQPLPTFSAIRFADAGMRGGRAGAVGSRGRRHRSTRAGRLVRRAVPVRAADDAKRRRQRDAQRRRARRAHPRVARRGERRVLLFARTRQRQSDRLQPDVRAAGRRPRGSGDRHRERTARLLSGAPQGRGRRRQARSMLSLQGVKMGRPSHVHISIGVEGGDIRSVRVGGEAVLAGEGTLYIS